MTRPRMVPCISGAHLAAILALSIVSAADSQVLAQTKDERAKQQRLERLRTMERRARAIKIYEKRDDADVEVQLRVRPLLRFHDPVRDFHDATLWAWGKSGRPIALLTLERYPRMWSYELVSLSAGRISAVLADGRRWTPREPGVQ